MNARTYSSWVFGLAALSPFFGALLTGLEGKAGAGETGLTHLVFAGVLAASLVVQAAALRSAGRNAKLLNGLAILLLSIEALSGRGGTAPLPDSTAVLHAVLAPLVAGVCAAIPDLLTPSGDPVRLEHAAVLRSASIWLPPLTLMQIVFGALYRHKIWGVLPHMAGALVVALLALIVCTLLLQRAPEKTALRSAAAMLLTAVLTQVTLGIAAFVMRLLELDTIPSFTIVAALHVATGSAVFFTSCILALRAQKIALGESQ